MLFYSNNLYYITKSLTSSSYIDPFCLIILDSLVRLVKFFSVEVEKDNPWWNKNLEALKREAGIQHSRETTAEILENLDGCIFLARNMNFSRTRRHLCHRVL